MLIEENAIPKIVATKHNDNSFVFYYYNGNSDLAKFTVGKFSEENPNGAQTETDAIETMKMNVEGLII